MIVSNIALMLRSKKNSIPSVYKVIKTSKDVPRIREFINAILFTLIEFLKCE